MSSPHYPVGELWRAVGARVFKVQGTERLWGWGGSGGVGWRYLAEQKQVPAVVGQNARKPNLFSI